MNFITEIADKLKFPNEASVYFGECFDKLLMTTETISELYSAMDNLFCEDDNKYIEILKKVSLKCGISCQAIDMVFLLMSAKSLYYMYKQKNLSDELFFDTLVNLKHKLLECKKLYGEWGIFSTECFNGFYKLRRFKIGRLQYEICKSDFVYKDALLPGDYVFACHIPASGPLYNHEVIESLHEARRFFADYLKDGKFVVSCNSWLLYPPIAEKLAESSNIKKFYDLFDIINVAEDAENSDFCRVFDVDYSPGILDTVTADNSLKQVIVNLLKSGKNMGLGQGIIVVDENY